MADVDYSLLNKVFTRAVIKDFSNNRIPTNIAFFDAVEQFLPNPALKTNGELFEALYSVLKREYRNEYYYKNTLLNNLLLGVHSTRTTTALTELPVGNAKADFILINGKAVVYEIKTQLDNFDRLNDQVENYYKAFSHVAVVSCEKNRDSLLKRYENSPVGIYIINKRGCISQIKLPTANFSELNSSVLFSILRKQEYEDILKNFGETLPNTSAFEYYDCCRNIFCNYDIISAYQATLKQLKRRKKITNPIFYKIPNAIKSLGYFEELSDSQFTRLGYNLSTQYRR